MSKIKLLKSTIVRAKMRQAKMFYYLVLGVLLFPSWLAYGQDCFLESDGEVVIEAENYFDTFTGVDRDWKSFTDPSASEGIAMRVFGTNASTGSKTTGPKMVYQINFTRTGTYYIWVKTASENAEPANNSIHVGVDENCLTCEPTDKGIGKNEADFTWTNTISGSKRRLKVDITKTGTHSLQVWMREDGVKLDKIYLSDDPDAIPDISGRVDESDRGACGSVCQGNVLLNSQAQVNVFDCNQIIGNLIIEGDDIVDLSPLRNLKSLEGSFSDFREAGDLIIRNNPLLTSLDGLDNLDEIGSALVIDNNPQLIDITALKKINSIGNVFHGLLAIHNNNLLPNLNGLEGLYRVSITDTEVLNGTVSIKNNASLRNMQALRNIEEFNIEVFIENNDQLQNLDGLDRMIYTYNVVIRDNDQLKSLDGLGTGIANSIIIANNPQLENIRGLSGSELARYLGRSTELVIENNDQLLSLEGLENMEGQTINNLVVKDNDQLSACCPIYKILAGLNNFYDIDISNNAPGCNSLDDLTLNCPNLAGTCFLERQGKLSMEAEDFLGKRSGMHNREWTVFLEGDQGNTNELSHNLAMQVNGEGVNTGSEISGAQLNYHMKFNTPGKYRIWLRTAAQDGRNANNSLHVGFDGNCITCESGSFGMGEVNADFTWTNTVRGLNIPLIVEVNRVGIYSLQLYVREDGVKVDKIYLTKFRDVPTGLGMEQSNRFNCPESLQFPSLGEESNKISIYPNPSNNYLKFKIANDTKIEKVLVYDSYGNTFIPTLTESNQININDLRKGVYKLFIITEGQNFMSTFIKE